MTENILRKGILQANLIFALMQLRVLSHQIPLNIGAGVGCVLTWSRRMKIALDAAKGLAFLHGAERSIIYRDFKTSNILLDAVSSLKT